MGKHRHYRVCIDGVKDHSTGGLMYDHLMEYLLLNRPTLSQTEMHQNGQRYCIMYKDFPVGTSRALDDPIDLVIFCITRCNARHHRILTKILTPCLDKSLEFYYILEIPMDVHFDLRKPQHKSVYDNLGKIYTHRNMLMYGVSNPVLE